MGEQCMELVDDVRAMGAPYRISDTMEGLRPAALKAVIGAKSDAQRVAWRTFL